MTNYIVNVIQSNRFEIMAPDAEEARRIANEQRKYSELWDETDPTYKCDIEVSEKVEGEGV